MRTLIGAGLVLMLACGTAFAEEKFDAKKLVGKWEPTAPKKGDAMVMEFTKDGKVIVTGSLDGKEVKIEGTYKLDGEKLSFKLTFNTETVDESVTITKLTDDELEGKDKKGEVEAFKKVKPKEKEKDKEKPKEKPKEPIKEKEER
jgi:uncharacterized protein (TIGR03066 family)